MDFSDFDLRSASERGEWVHLHSGGAALYLQPDKTVGHAVTEHPCRVHIRGVLADGVYGLLKRVQIVAAANAQREARAKDRDLESVIERGEAALQPLMRDLIAAAVSDWENIVIKDEFLKPTRENVLRICGPETAFFRQVYDAILEQRDFFERAARG